MRIFEKHCEYGNSILEKSFQFGARIVKFCLLSSEEGYQIKDSFK